MGIQEAYTQLMYQLFELYDDRESANIADWTIEHITGFKRIDRITNKQFPLNILQEESLKTYTEQLLQHKPVQYILHEAWFAGIKFYVDENVLIPRPETEELVMWIVEETKKSKVKNQKVLDIGTGSGCIPIALKKKLPELDVHALDVSEDALNVAKKNAVTQNVDITFYKTNILDRDKWNSLPLFDIIVSNPPYIKQSEEKEMRDNVLLHEPHLALFVPDEDALLFYKTITELGLQHLNKDGQLFFEINEMLGNEVKDLLKQKGYSNIEIKKDMQGKDRMVKASFT
ncbi:peptide chain release factor N(5)-glutamine methyltransferase [Panacibacter ginsenosidivorans]|uniref:peptide chain release factor N(5)-glutamine methyltransferase n=1 Tax=Panacibacter ginsenosidivorans TaxID=1813871 RepID=A0A5B8V8L5_9BACT|nr:peptide chain release factor N(5)-glutamine methyltransferase [Panacibacter ginsenosidivorans]QEC67505.1 peptide chain release factor N(5)-glutamine methyltransferase [Panacibacter ginsenosidivorans]